MTKCVSGRANYPCHSPRFRPIRIVGLCHSTSNAKDLGDWIGATSHGLFNFPPGSRPVPLEVHVQGFDITNFEARMQVRPRRGAVRCGRGAVRCGAACAATAAAVYRDVRAAI